MFRDVPECSGMFRVPGFTHILKFRLKINKRHCHFFWCLCLLRHIFSLGIIAAMSLITLGLRLVNLKGSLDKHLYTYTNAIYLLSFITAHAVELLMPVQANGSNC